jgi:hypothetical protein
VGGGNIVTGAERATLNEVAMYRIVPVEEVCFDYAMTDGSPCDEFECGCGLSDCRGYITGSDWKRAELQERYKGYFSPYLQGRIVRLQNDAQQSQNS